MSVCSNFPLMVWMSVCSSLSPLVSFRILSRTIVASWNGLIILTGDLNIDFCKTSDPKTKTFMSLLSSLNLYQHVKKPTRIARTTSTINDYIISNTPNRITHTDVIPCPTISDHDAPYAYGNIRTIRYEPR